MPPKRKATAEASGTATRGRKARKVSTAFKNERPNQPLDVYVFGSGESCELGLGSLRRNGKRPMGVRSPRLNDLLDATTVGVVQIAVGGMHCLAITNDNQILSWGINDDGALGRDTTWHPPERDIDAGSDSDSEAEDNDDTGLNPVESTPTAIPADSFEGDPTWAQVACTDSASFALTSTGEVYGWGCFNSHDGPVGFSLHTRRDGISKQKTPIRIPELRNIKQLAGGGNHMLALDNNDDVWSWGDGAQFQLGRAVNPRYRDHALQPVIQTGLFRHHTKFISAGGYHSFAIDKEDRVWSWGLNNYGQTGITHNAGQDRAFIERPRIVESLRGLDMLDIQCGLHHSIACTTDGEVRTWGRCDYGQSGVAVASLPAADTIEGKILLVPTVVEDITARKVDAAIDNCIVINPEGKVFAWGFSDNYRTGLGTEDTVFTPQAVENTAIKDKVMTFVGCGGQFSVLAGPSDAIRAADAAAAAEAEAPAKGKRRAKK